MLGLGFCLVGSPARETLNTEPDVRGLWLPRKVKDFATFSLDLVIGAGRVHAPGKGALIASWDPILHPSYSPSLSPKP